MDIKQTSLSNVSTTRRTAARGGVEGASSKSSFKAVTNISPHVMMENVASLNSIDVVGLFDLAVNPDQHKRPGFDYGEALLERLDQFHQQVAMGQITPDLLKELRTRLNAMPLTHMDPKLHTLVEDIRIRASVELAKLGY